MADDATDGQRWLDRRLDGLEPGNFAHEGGTLLMCSSRRLAPPRRFAQGWFGLPEPRRGAMYVAPRVAGRAAIVVFADPGSEVEVNSVCEFARIMDREIDVPPILWVPHSTAPELRQRGSNATAQRRRSFDTINSHGIDAVIAGEPEGWSLTLAVRTCIVNTAAAAAAVSSLVNERRAASHQIEYLKRCIDVALWDYLGVRCASCIPPIDLSIPRGEVAEIDGYSVGHLLGQGMCGKVFMLQRSAGEEGGARPGDYGHPLGVQQVLKVVSKGRTTGTMDLKYIRRMIDVMRLLSSDSWRHENVVQLYGVYHSSTHLFFRMEYGGPMNLFRRLVLRQKDWLPHQRLPLGKAASLLSQAIGVIAFLQLGPRVCHRDLKPESFTINETADTLTLKLSDFDSACIRDSAHSEDMHYTCPRCGTFPFLAPEVLLEQEYSGEAADVWSLGVVLLEVLCGPRFLARNLDLPMDGQCSIHRDLGSRITKFFQPPGAVSDMLEGAIRQELLPLQPLLLGGIQGMLTLAPPDRMRAADLQLLSRDVPTVARAGREQPI